MRLRLAVVVLLLGAACSRPAPVPGGAPGEYAASDGSFTVRLPGGWRVDEAPGETRKAAFFGPPAGAKPFSELISVSYYPEGGRYKGVDDYVAAQAALGRAEPTREVLVGGARAVEMSVATVFPDIHSGPQPLITRVVAVPAAGGFYALEHTRPSASPPSAEFDELVRSFQAKRAKGP